jgi:heme-degrading monooxygenase HmoA
MISRHWKGIAKPGRAADYIDHLRSETLPTLNRIPGFVSGTILHREVDEGTEFLIVTVWESLKPIKAFVGDDLLETAVVPQVVREMMVTFDSQVVHYEVAGAKPR